MTTASRAAAALDAALSHLLAATLVVLVLMDAVFVLLRYAAGIGVIWSSDVGLLLLMVLAWLGLPLLWLKGSHIAIDLVSGRSSAGAKRTAALSLHVAFATFALALAFVAIQAMEAFSFIDMPSLPVSAAIKFAPILAGAGLSVVAAGLRLAQLVDFEAIADERP